MKQLTLPEVKESLGIWRTLMSEKGKRDIAFCISHNPGQIHGDDGTFAIKFEVFVNGVGRKETRSILEAIRMYNHE